MNLIEKQKETDEIAPILVVSYHNMAVELEYLKRNGEVLNMYSKAVSLAEEFLPDGHAVMDNVKSVYHNALKESQEGKKKKKTGKNKSLVKKPEENVE